MDDLNWRSLNAALPSLQEKELADLLEAELLTARRPAIVKRLHQRYSVLRTTRERAEIMERVKK